MKYTLDHFAKDKTIHFVGIGGIGMSAIAKILLGKVILSLVLIKKILATLLN